MDAPVGRTGVGAARRAPTFYRTAAQTHPAGRAIARARILHGQGIWRSVPIDEDDAVGTGICGGHGRLVFGPSAAREDREAARDEPAAPECR